jgi:glutamyl-tRNA synthetase
MGYLPEALVNYLLLLSWSPGGDRELIGLDEAVKLFDIKQVNKTAATFDLKKLDWMNNQYLKSANPDKLADLVIPDMLERGLIQKEGYDRNYIVEIVKLFQVRLPRLGDFCDWADFFFLKEVNMDPKAKEKYLANDLSKEFRLFIQRLDALKDFNIAAIEEAFRELVAQLGIEAKVLIHPVRVALTGKTIGPGLFEVIYYLGKERTKERLSCYL